MRTALLALFLLQALDAAKFVAAGDLKFAAGDFKGALQDYNKAVAIDARNAPGYYGRGMCKLRLGVLDQALTDHSAAIKINPKYAFAFCGRADTLHKMGKPDKAIPDYTSAVGLDDKCVPGWTGRAAARTDVKDLDGAIADYSRACDLVPTYAEYFHLRGLVRLRKDDYERAHADFTRVVFLHRNPPDGKAWLQRGVANFWIHQFETSLADLTRASAAAPRDAAPLFWRGLSALARGNPKQSREDLSKALSLDSKVPLATGWRAHALYAAQDWAEALKDYRKACEVEEGGMDRLCLMIWLARARLGELEPASKELREYLEKRAPDDEWLKLAASFLTGAVLEADYLKNFEEGRDRRTLERRCDARFYAGTKRLLGGEKALALEHFKACAAAGVLDRPSSILASIERSLLEPPVPK